MVDKIRYATPQQLFASGKDCLRKQPQGISSKMQQYRNNIYIYRFTLRPLQAIHI